MPNAPRICVWTGEHDTCWYHPLNWQGRRVPTNGDSAHIPGGCAHYPRGALACGETLSALVVCTGASCGLGNGTDAETSQDNETG